ncbi:sensor histidine kinase [Rothia aerolata]|nr:histidine kinase [Rothia aerolata]
MTQTLSSDVDAAGAASVAQTGARRLDSWEEPPTTLWRQLRSPLFLLTKAPWIALLHLVILSVVPGVAVAITSTIVGILFLPLLAIGYAVFERWRLTQLGYSTRDNHVAMNRNNLWEWAKFRYQETATWREVGALLVAIILGSVAGLVLTFEIILFVLAIGTMIWLINGGTLTSWGIYSNGLESWQITQAEFARSNEKLLLALPDLHQGTWWIPLLAALVMLPIFAYINGILAAASGSLSHVILQPRPEEYEKQLARLSASRSTIVDSFESERRRIERDLHDGVQQELVNINLRLGLAEMEAKRLGQEGANATLIQEQVAGAREQLAHALETLRNTVRGIYPAVLETHGLGAALEELSRNTLTPVYVSYLVNERLAPEVERTAYYVASEGVANALKHSGAHEIKLEAYTARSMLVLTVEDNGTGGASLAGGSGLAGLTERVAALGGQLTVFSPAGGPTRLRMELPSL